MWLWDPWNLPKMSTSLFWLGRFSKVNKWWHSSPLGISFYSRVSIWPILPLANDCHAGILEVLHCILIESPEALNLIAEGHIKSIISLLDKHGRNHKVGTEGRHSWWLICLSFLFLALISILCCWKRDVQSLDDFWQKLWETGILKIYRRTPR